MQIKMQVVTGANPTAQTCGDFYMQIRAPSGVGEISLEIGPDAVYLVGGSGKINYSGQLSSPPTNWHTYRLEHNRNTATAKLIIDNQNIATDVPLATNTPYGLVPYSFGDACTTAPLTSKVRIQQSQIGVKETYGDCEEMPDNLKSPSDLNKDCRVDLKNLMLLAENWLDCISGDCMVGILDLALFVQNWLNCVDPRGCL